ncbi:MAG: patatin-like phospholipase family protein [Chloroflexi bacterium]|nr:patatin-like phospholipase family protein [Chloroflexota bacterium]
MSTLTHTPIGANPAGYDGPNRSLVLSGGGIRVSYQAGAMRALLESGLSFSHVDATSGGSINLAMMLSGLSSDEICERWRTLNVTKSISLMPLLDYVRIRDRVALGDGDGFRDRVFPHLGIDMDRVRAAAGMDGTFNVLNYSRKVNEVIRHQDMDMDMLVAGLSLPMFLPPISKGGSLYLDSAFVRDANLMEAVRRGAEELWVIWCLGNTSVYRGGMLNLYIQMLEMSACGALHQEFELINDVNRDIAEGRSRYGQQGPIKLHFIKPETPLPLDPELFMGRIDSATLIEMGYSDAQRYLSDMSDEGVPLTPETTHMLDAPSPNFQLPTPSALRRMWDTLRFWR